MFFEPLDEIINPYLDVKTYNGVINGVFRNINLTTILGDDENVFYPTELTEGIKNYFKLLGFGTYYYCWMAKYVHKI